MAETKYYDLTPRKLLDESAEDLTVHGDTGCSEGVVSPFVVATSLRGRPTGRRGPESPRRQKAVNKENVGPSGTPPKGTQGTLTKAALKRQQVVEEMSHAQADARSRLCIFKAKENAELGNDADSASKHDELSTVSSRKALTVPEGPTLRTLVRGSSRSRSANRNGESSVRSVGTPGRHGMSVRSMSSTPLRHGRSQGQPELSCCSRATSRERSIAGAPYLSLRGLTVPKEPCLATARRSRSHSVGMRTPSAHSVGTPEKSVRSTCSLTAPQGPLLLTGLRQRSRSVGERTPSAHSTCSIERSVRSCRALTIARGPVLATEVRSRSRLRTPSVGTPEASVRSASFHSCCSRRGASVRSRSVSQPPLTIPVGPVLETEIRSWSRSRRAQTCMDQSEKTKSAASKRASSRSASFEHAARATRQESCDNLTEDAAGGSKSAGEEFAHESSDTAAAVEAHSGETSAADGVSSGDTSAICNSSSDKHKVETPQEVASEEKAIEETQKRKSGELKLPGVSPRSLSETPAASAPDEQNGSKDDTSSDFDDSKLASLEANAQVKTPSSLFAYLPETPQRLPAAAEGGSSASRLQGKSLQRRMGDTFDAMATPEGRAESRKQQVLAKVAEEQQSIRKQHFVFGKAGSTPIRTPLRKKASTQNNIGEGVSAESSSQA